MSKVGGGVGWGGGLGSNHIYNGDPISLPDLVNILVEKGKLMWTNRCIIPRHIK